MTAVGPKPYCKLTGEYDSEIVVKIGQYLTKFIMCRVLGSYFFVQPCIALSLSCIHYM